METRGRGEKKEEGAEGGKVDTQGLVFQTHDDPPGVVRFIATY